MPEWEFETLDGHLKAGDIFASRGDVISKIDIEKTPGKYPIYSSSAKKNGKFGEYGKYMFNEELITWSVDGGGNFFHRQKHKFSVTNVCGYLRVINKDIDPLFLFYSLDDQHSRLNFDYQSKAHPSVIRKLYKIPKIDKLMQLKIAQVIRTLDTQIEQTEALIAKQENIRQGLMQDLFTRGVDETGQLRPAYRDAPHLYHETELGWLPLGWGTPTLDDFALSKSDATIGPFGSNLVATDYKLSGVPVIFVRDVKANQFAWVSSTYVSKSKAQDLRAHQSRPGDIIATKMGLPPCVSCVHPYDFPDAIITADMIRLRVSNKEQGIPEYIGCAINSETVKAQVRAITSGVTRPKITLADFRTLKVPCPKLDEQKLILDNIKSHKALLKFEMARKENLQNQKAGLMRDLLSGEVSVAPIMEEVSA